MFRIEKKLEGKLGRAGVLHTAHGDVETPAFVVVGTKATVKALTPAQIKETGAHVVLGNTYHLYLEPGEQVVEAVGGLGKFMGWDGPTMTDSGGFQVFSLGAAFGKTNRSKITSHPPSSTPDVEGGRTHKQHTDKPEIVGLFPEEMPLAKIDEDGVMFRSYKDGSSHRFTPERSVGIQHALGSDIIFAFDECTSADAPKEYQREAMERTHRWALRSLVEHQRTRKGLTLGLEKGQSLAKSQALFGIVQGGRHEDLRKESARVIGAMDFDGFGIGGSFDKEDMGSAVRWVIELLPEEKPRHLLGIGNPLDMFEAVEQGCDLFDCVAPTREARTGALYAKRGRINIENAKYRSDFSPIEDSCECYSCKNFTKSYLAHLFRSGEILASTLATIHNVYFTVQLVKKMRQTILDGTFPQHKRDFLKAYKK